MNQQYSTQKHGIPYFHSAGPVARLILVATNPRIRFFYGQILQLAVSAIKKPKEDPNRSEPIRSEVGRERLDWITRVAFTSA